MKEYKIHRCDWCKHMGWWPYIIDNSCYKKYGDNKIYCRIQTTLENNVFRFVDEEIYYTILEGLLNV